MPAFAKVDETGKLTVSLGGACRLRCKHCYITASQFQFNRNLSVDEAISEIDLISDDYDTVCISGDTDPLLRESDFLAFLVKIVETIRPKNVMFTTRLLPSERSIRVIEESAVSISERGGFMVPCVSFVSACYPNEIEDAKKVPSARIRADLLARFRGSGMPTFAAFRPTFPFELVPRADVDALVEMVDGAASCILGEVFLLDDAGEIAERIGLPSGLESGNKEALTFLDQGNRWRKRVFKAELDYIRFSARKVKIPFFIRSMSAIRHLEANWDHDLSDWRPNIAIPVTGCFDNLLP